MHQVKKRRNRRPHRMKSTDRLHVSCNSHGLRVLLHEVKYYRKLATLALGIDAEFADVLRRVGVQVSVLPEVGEHLPVRVCISCTRHPMTVCSGARHRNRQDVSNVTMGHVVDNNWEIVHEVPV